MKTTLIVYLHGFRSSPRSSKAVLTGDAIKNMSTATHHFEWYCPQLLASPKASVAMVANHIANTNFDELVLIGSSLGGYYANYLAEKYGCKAISLNPAVRAPRELANQVGMLTVYDTDEPYDFRPEYIDELQDLQIDKISAPDRYFLIAAKGDELLDWREMADFYQGSKQLILEGSDHGIADYSKYLPSVLHFITQ